MQFLYIGPTDTLGHYFAGEPVPATLEDVSIWDITKLDLSIGEALEFEIVTGLRLCPYVPPPR